MSFVATKVCLSRQNFCVCRDKHTSKTTQKEKPDRATQKKIYISFTKPPPRTTQKKILTNQNKSHIYLQNSTDERPDKAIQITYLPPEQHRRKTWRSKKCHVFTSRATQEKKMAKQKISRIYLQNNTEEKAISTFSPVCSMSSNGLRMRVYVCL